MDGDVNYNLLRYPTKTNNMKNYVLLLLGIAFLINDVSAQKKNKNLEKKETIHLIKMPEDRILKNGFWLDFGFGIASVYKELSLDPSPYISHSVNMTDPSDWLHRYAVDFAFGNKWYYPKGKFYQFGFQVTWLAGAMTFAQGWYLDVGSLGFCSLFRVSKKAGIEVNLNAGPSFLITNVGYIGGQVNLECKYRVGFFSIGTRFRYFRGWYGSRYSLPVANLTLLVGVKF